MLGAEQRQVSQCPQGMGLRLGSDPKGATRPSRWGVGSRSCQLPFRILQPGPSTLGGSQPNPDIYTQKSSNARTPTAPGPSHWHAAAGVTHVDHRWAHAGPSAGTLAPDGTGSRGAVVLTRPRALTSAGCIFRRGHSSPFKFMLEKLPVRNRPRPRRPTCWRVQIRVDSWVQRCRLRGPSRSPPELGL